MPHYIKKTIELDEECISKVRTILSVKTDKEAVNAALRLVSDEDDIIKVQDNLAGKLDIEDIFK